MSEPAFVEVRRAGLIESRHFVSAVLVNERDELLAWVGDFDLTTYFRSSAKPFQALPLVADGVADAFQLTESELAIVCASHSGEPKHVRMVQDLLHRIGCSANDLECGPHAPFHTPSALSLVDQGVNPTRLHNNCSGKHAGMLAWARHRGVNTKDYRLADHPVQQRIRQEIAVWAGDSLNSMPTAVDGCGVITFALPLTALAGAYARLVADAERDDESPAGRVLDAMTGNPYYVGGTGRLVTQLIEVTGGRILAKEGAEGVICVGDRERRWGLALKVMDGRERAMGPALLHFLAEMKMMTDAELVALDDFHAQPVKNTRDETVGEIRAHYRVERGDAL